MADEKIKIDIEATYDDDDAKQALKDAKALEAADPTVSVDADTAAAQTDLGKVTDTAEKLSSRDWIAKVLADTEQAKGDIDQIETKLHDVDDAATTTGQRLGDEIEHGTTKAGGAVHSMAGNTIGDAAAMATGFGPLGEALGQITEGALGGEVALREMLSAGLGLAAITVVAGAIQKGLEANKKIDAFNTKKIDDFVAALKTAKGELDILNTAIRKDDKVEWVDAATGNTKDLTLALGDAGITLDDFLTAVAGGKDKFHEWLAATGPMIGAGGDLNAIIQAGTQFLNDRAAAQKLYDDRLIVSGQVAHETDRETRRLNAAFVDGSAALDDLNPKTDTFSHHVNTAAENTAKLNENYRRLLGKLDEQDAWATVNQSVKDYNENTKHSDEDTRNLIRSIAEYVVTTDTIPESKKTKILVDLNAGDVAAAEADLTELARQRDIRLLITAVGSQDTIKFLRSITRGGTGIVDEAATGPIGLAGGAPASINVTLPRGARHADIARALGVSSRRNGRRYEQVTYARR
jgi:hypothetical protein